MQTKLKKSTAFFISLAIAIFTGLFAWHTRTFASQTMSQEDLSREIEFLNELKMKQLFPARMMNTLNEALPEGTWLTRLNYFKSNLSLEGFARSNELVGTFITNIKAQGGILYNEKVLGLTKFNYGGRVKIFFRINFSCKEITINKRKKKRVDETVLKELKRKLYNKNEATGIAKKIEAIIRNSNLTVRQWTSAPSNAQTRYGELSQFVDVQGNFQNLAVFFNNLARMNKIITINELSFEALSLEEEEPTVTARFNFSIYISDSGE